MEIRDFRAPLPSLKGRALPALLAGLALGGAGPSQAQAAPAAAAAAASAPPADTSPEAEPDGPGAVQRVQVEGRRNGRSYQAGQARSATKTDTALIDTPQAIVVVPRAVIEDQGANDLYEVARNVSGVSRQVSYWGQNNGNFRVRGFDLDEGNGYLRDGFRYFSRGKVFLANVASVEILKGPASVLYGRVEPGGLANLVTQEPAATPRAGWELSAGRWEQFGLGGFATGPVDDEGTLRYRVDGRWEDGRSFRDWAYDRSVAVAPQLLWQPDADTRVKLYTEYLRQDTLADYGIPGWQGRPADVPIHWNYGEPFNRQGTTQWRGMLSVQRQVTPDWLARVGLSTSEYRYDEGYQEVYGSWVGDYGPDGSGPSDGIARLYRYWGRQAPRHERSYAQAEVVGKLRTGALDHTLLLGAEAGWQNEASGGAWSAYPSLEIFNPVHTLVYQPQPGQMAWAYTSRDRLRGLYLQDEIALGQAWRLLLGARHDRYVQAYDYVSPPDYDVHTTTTDGKVSPRAGLLWKATGELSFYASWSQSFAPASAWYAADQNKRFKPLIGEQQEVGMKWSGEDGRLTMAVALYDLRKKNIVTQDPSNPQFSIQLGEERSTGVELDLAAKPTPSLDVIASFSRMHARISEGDASGWYPAGNALPFAPRSSGSLWLSWRLPTADRWQAGIGAFGQGRRQGDLGNTIALPGYVRWDASLGWSDGPWQVALCIENLGNRRYWDSGTGWGAAVLYPGAPRSATLSIRRAW